VKEYHFVDIDDELQKYTDRRTTSTCASSLENPPKNMAYAPSVTITPTTIYVKALKLAKTNRTIREPKFGGIFNFCLGKTYEILLFLLFLYSS